MPVEAVETAVNRPAEPVTQFSVFIPNRVGRLQEFISLLASVNIHALALTVLDTTDNSIIRTVLDDPQKARKLFARNNFPFTEGPLVAVEINSLEELNRLISALLEAELNINYLYSFIAHPNGKPILGLSLEDNEMAEQVLKQYQFAVLKQSDLVR